MVYQNGTLQWLVLVYNYKLRNNTAKSRLKVLYINMHRQRCQSTYCGWTLCHYHSQTHTLMEEEIELLRGKKNNPYRLMAFPVNRSCIQKRQSWDPDPWQSILTVAITGTFSHYTNSCTSWFILYNWRKFGGFYKIVTWFETAADYLTSSNCKMTPCSKEQQHLLTW